MTKNTIFSQIISRNDTSHNWEIKNPILSQGEIGYDNTNKKIKIGDGISHWNDLNYILLDELNKKVDKTEISNTLNYGGEKTFAELSNDETLKKEKVLYKIKAGDNVVSGEIRVYSYKNDNPTDTGTYTISTKTPKYTIKYSAANYTNPSQYPDLQKLITACDKDYTIEYKVPISIGSKIWSGTAVLSGKNGPTLILNNKLDPTVEGEVTTGATVTIIAVYKRVFVYNEDYVMWNGTTWTTFSHSIEPVNTLTSTDKNKPLSANQGKILNDKKVDKVDGKGLSTNDYTDSDKKVLNNISVTDNIGISILNINGGLKTSGPVTLQSETTIDSKNLVFSDKGISLNDCLNNKPGKIGEGLNSEIFNDYEGNNAISDYSHVEGYGNIAGTKCFTVSSVTENTTDNTSICILDSVDGLEVGDSIEIFMLSTLNHLTRIENIGTITSINSDTKTIVTNAIPLLYPYNSSYIYYVRAKDKPTVGTLSYIAITSHAEGYTTKANAGFAHSEGYSTTASGIYSHAEGEKTESSARASHAEGYRSNANSDYSHAEGHTTSANGGSAHSEGYKTQAIGDYSHAEGGMTQAKAPGSHTEGDSTIASAENQHVQGVMNIEDTESKYAHIVGNGSVDKNTRSNAHTLDWDGNAWFAGNITVGGTSYDDVNAKELATTEYVDDISNTKLSTGDIVNDLTHSDTNKALSANQGRVLNVTTVKMTGNQQISGYKYFSQGLFATYPINRNNNPFDDSTDPTTISPTSVINYQYLENYANSKKFKPSQISPQNDNTSGNVPLGYGAETHSVRNVSSFLPADAVSIEYTTDGGTTWIDYGASDEVKRKLFAEDTTIYIKIGDRGITTDEITDQCMTRVTIDPMVDKRYSNAFMFYCWVTTGGVKNMKCKIECSTIGEPDVFTVVRDEVDVSGWSGPNTITFTPRTFGGGTNQTTNQRKYRFTFRSLQPNNKIASFADLRLYGYSVWTAKNNYMKAGTIYSTSYDQNVTFPAQVSANTLEIGNNGTIGTNLTNAIQSITNDIPVATTVPATLAVNTIYDVGQQTTLNLNLPTGKVGNYIQVDFLSPSTPTTLGINSAAGISDFSLVPSANTIYSLYFEWGTLYYNSTTSKCVYGWRFKYDEYTHTV